MGSAYVDSYLNEEAFLQGKNRPVPRLLREECGVVSFARGCSVIACRGVHFEPGASFVSSLRLSHREEVFFFANVGKHPRLLLDTPMGPCLVFADLLEKTGLFCALLLPKGVLSSVAAALARCSSVPFLLRAPASLRGAPAAEDRALCEELLFYMELVFSRRPSRIALLWRECTLLAEFAGCTVERTAFPAVEGSLSDRDSCKFRLFLLCSFLTLRRTGSGVSTAVGAPEGDFLLRVEQKKQYGPFYKRKKASAREAFFHQFLFLKESVFADFWVCVPEVGVILNGKLAICEPSERLRSRVPSAWSFSMQLIPTALVREKAPAVQAAVSPAYASGTDRK